MREISAQALESHKFRPSDNASGPKTAVALLFSPDSI